MQQLPLTGSWLFRQVGTGPWLPAQVPGGVHTDLLAADLIPDPFVGDNEKRVQWVAESDWEYRRTFAVGAGILDEESVELVCDGLDTLAEIRLNGELLGQTANQFRSYRWQVRDRLLPGENELSITFRSPLRYIAQRWRERRLPSVEDMLIPGGQYLRKAPYHFGWDWGPKLTTIGIWQEIRLEAWSIARLDDVHLRQHHTGSQVTVTAQGQVRLPPSATVVTPPLTLEMAVTSPGGDTLHSSVEMADEAGSVALTIPDPELWWPNGHGGQPLYRVAMRLRSGEELLDERRYKIGLRTIELRQERDEWGHSFTFVVNGRPIFCKGSNWIPADSFPTRVTAERLEHLISSAVATHQNMLRVWGGGYYESEAFYDLCDRYGLLVWQDFIFACAAYPLHDDAFVDGIHPEVVEQVRRLRHRACLALWCGNNEMEVAWFGWGWDQSENADLKAADEHFFNQTLPSWVATEDPDHAYWPSSPSSGTLLTALQAQQDPPRARIDPNGDAEGDTHQWQVWHALEPFQAYHDKPSRFVSEFGFQSLPALPTVASFAEPFEWNMTSYIMEHHQKNLGGNGRIMTYLTSHFRIPKDFASLVYVSQLLEAEALRVGVEHWRCLRPRTAGTLYWQLNDCWPVASWSTIDYFGRWKAAHYAARRFYAPLLLAAEVSGFTTTISAHNDSPQPCAAVVRWSLETVQGEPLHQGELPLALEPFTAVTPVAQLDFSNLLTEEKSREVLLVCELSQPVSPEGERQSLLVAPFVPNKHLNLQDPQLIVAVTADNRHLTIEVKARSLARFVELTLEGADIVFSDNYFDLPANRPHLVTCPLPPGWTREQATAALRIRSLHDA